MQDRLEDLEAGAAGATIVILIGIVFETIAEFLLPGDHAQRTLATIGNVLVGIGLIHEFLATRITIIDTREENRESDLKVAEANKAAAEAHQKANEAHARATRAELESEKLKAQFAGRRIGLKQILLLSNAIRDVPSTLDLLIEFQASDPEAFVYANDFIDLFRGAGVERIRFTGNSHLSGMVFGLWLSASDKAVATSIVDAFTAAGMPLSVGEIDLSKHLPRNEVAPNLYIFVGPKLPAAIHTTSVSVVNTEETDI